MTFLQRLRHYKSLPLGLALWFAFSVGASVAAPLFKHQHTIEVCGANGVILQSLDTANLSQDGSGDAPSAVMHCPMYLTVGAGVSRMQAGADMPQASAIDIIFSTHYICGEAGTAWSRSRGPPAPGMAA